MHYSSIYSGGLEYIVGSYSGFSYSKINYFSRFADDKYGSGEENTIIFEPSYVKMPQAQPYKNTDKYFSAHLTSHAFTPEIFLKPSRPKANFVVDNDESRRIAEEVFELMTKEKLPDNISINVLPLDEFKLLHSMFGAWSSGILGFSLNGKDKKIFVRENHLDILMLVIGHEIGHVLTETLPNKHDEEAKAFAFSVGWANTIKRHDIANLGLSIKDDFDPAKNGLHDVASGFVDFAIKAGRKPMQLHDALAKRYLSVFDKLYS